MVEKRLASEGPQALMAYMPLISKYDLHMLEICKSAQELSEELAKQFLTDYMLKESTDTGQITQIVGYFSNYDIHKSHGRSIDREKARELGLTIINLETVDTLAPLIRSLYNQYYFWFNVTAFYKNFENAHGINWGQQVQMQVMPIQQPLPQSLPQPLPQPSQP